MSKCPYYSEDMISLYVEGLLDKDENFIFEKHLQNCDECLESVINLRRDLFRMGVLENQIYKGAYLIEAVFMLIKNKLIILRDISNSYHFQRERENLKLRGVKDDNTYNVEIKEISIRVSKDGVDKFLVEINNVKDKYIELFCNEKLIEAHAHINQEKLIINGLGKGEYVLVIHNENLKDSKRIKIKVN